MPPAADGVRVTGSPAEAVGGAEVVLTMLLDGEALLDALRQAAGALPPGALFLQMSTGGTNGLGSPRSPGSPTSIACASWTPPYWAPR